MAVSQQLPVSDAVLAYIAIMLCSRVADWLAVTADTAGLLSECVMGYMNWPLGLYTKMSTLRAGQQRQQGSSHCQ